MKLGIKSVTHQFTAFWNCKEEKVYYQQMLFYSNMITD